MIKKGNIVEFKNSAFKKYLPILGEDIYGTYIVDLVAKHGNLVLILPIGFVPVSTKSTMATLIILGDDLKDVTRLKKIEKLIR